LALEKKKNRKKKQKKPLGILVVELEKKREENVANHSSV